MNLHLRLYRDMLLIRAFEEQVENLFTQGCVQGTAHAAIGQEAVCVGVASALARHDWVTSTHRGHGHFLARGGDPRRVMAELFGKQTGYSHGRGGSQLMADYRLGFIGANGITGGSIALATGAALSFKLRATGQVAVCFFGDGASNQGSFHESLNMAGLWKLPVVFVCENNRYAMSTPVDAALANPDIAARAAAYAFPGVHVDGNDVLAVRQAAADAAHRARTGLGPTLLECATYRFSGHSRGDPRCYRTRAEELAARRRDPLRRFRAWLRQQHRLDTPTDTALRRAASAAVRAAVRFARLSPDPDPATLTEGLFA